MSNISAKDFITRLASDPTLRSQLGISTSMSLDQFQSKAAAAGYIFSPEEIMAAAQSQSENALSDEELNNVSGGLSSGSLSKNMIIRTTDG